MSASVWRSSAEWLGRSWAVMRRGWWRFAAVIAAMTAASVTLVVMASGFLPTLAYAQRGLVVDAGSNTVTVSGVLLILLELAVPLTVLVLGLLAWSLATVAILGADILSARPLRLVASAVRGARRTPSLLGALILAALGLALSLLLAPVLVVTGILGLLATPLVRLAQPRWPTLAHWPRIRTLVILALPFATTAALAVWWGLAVPCAVVEQRGPLQALGRSRQLVSARLWPAVLCLLAGAVVYVGSQSAVTGLHGLGLADDVALSLRVVSQTLLVAVPVVVATVLHRELSGSDARLDALGPADLARTVGRGVTSGVLAIALVAGLLIPLTGAPSTAQAEDVGVEPGVEQLAGLLGEDIPQSVSDLASEEPEPESESESESGPGSGSAPDDEEPAAEPELLAAGELQGFGPLSAPPTGGFVVDSLADLDDANPGDGLCADSAGLCTLRAAITEANEWPAHNLEITFSLDGTITLSTPLVVEVQLSIDGGENRIVVDGGSTAQLLKFTDAVPDFALRFLTLSNGRAPGGGGAIESDAARGEIDSVTFVGNASASAGGAVVVRTGELWFTNATFWKNHATQGSDIANIGGIVGVHFSTFVPESGSSLHNAQEEEWRLSVYFTLIDGECSGNVEVSASHAPASCGSTTSPVGLGEFGDHGGVVHTVALDYLSPAVDAYLAEEGGGTAVDARGVSRPQGAKNDYGAFELEGGGPPPPADEGPWPTWITVDGVDGNGSEFGEGVTFIATVWPNRPSTAPADAPEPTGSVLFRLGDAELSSVPLVGGVAAMTIDDLPVGVNEITAEYSGDQNYIAPPPSYRVLHTVEKIATTLSLVTSPESSVTGQQIDVTARLSVATPGGPPLAGTVGFWVGFTHLGDAELDAAGAATISTVGLDTGSHEITARFTPATADYRASELTVGHTVAAAATTTVLGASSDAPVFRQSLTFTAAVAVVGPGSGVPSGDVEFSDGSVTVSRPLVGGVAVYTTDGLDLGHNTMTARYLPAASGPPAYAGSSGDLDIEVGKAQVSLEASSTPAPSAVGQQITVRADVTARAPGGGTPGGTVELRHGGELLGSAVISAGAATFSTETLPVGLQQFTLVYSGDTHFHAASVNYEHRVSPVATTVSVSTGASSAVTGQPVRYTAQVNATGPGTATPSGTVVFGGMIDGTVRLTADGTAVLDAIVPPSSQGSASVSATFVPDDNLTATSTGFVTQNLARAEVTVSTTGPAAPVTLGDPIRLTVEVNGNFPSTTRPASGSIVVSREGTTLATVPVSSTGSTVVNLATWGGLGVGSHDLSVAYRGGIGYHDGVDAITAVVVPAAAELNLLVSPAGAAEYGAPVTMTAAVNVPFGLEPSGEVRIYDGSTLLHSGFVARAGGGWAVAFSTTGLSIGSHALRAEYSSWNTSVSHATTAQATIYEVRPISTVTNLVLGPILVGEPLSWSVLVRAGQGGSRPTGAVQLTIDGRTLPAVALREDPDNAAFSFATVTAPMSLSLPVGSHPITAEYLPTGVFAASSGAGEQSIVSYLSTVSLSARTTLGSGPWSNAVGGLSWGVPVEVRAQVAGASGAPGAPQPTGTIVIDGGADGVSCTVSAPSQSCVLIWPEAGAFALTAHYQGDINYGQESSALQYALIDRKTPAFARVGLQESRVVTGEPVTAYWDIAGPEMGEGTVRADFGSAPGCVATGPRGSCATTFGIGSAGQPQLVTVSYPQNNRWNAVSHTIPVTPVGCYPLEHHAAEGGTLTVLTAPNCNDGAGYLDNTEVWLRPSPLEHARNGHSWQFAGFAPALSGPGPDYHLKAGVGAGKTTRIAALFRLDIRCVTVRVTPQFSTSTAQLRPLGAPDCPLPDATHREVGQWQHAASGGYTGRFLLGSEVQTDVFLGGEEDIVYGYRWDSAIAMVETRRTAEAFIAERDTQVWVLAGPRCYAVSVSHSGPGHVSTAADRPGCYNPAEPAGRWTAGTVLELAATPAKNTLAYVDGWHGFEPESAVSFISDQLRNVTQRAEVATYTVVADQGTAALSVHFGTCRRLTIDPVTQGVARGVVDVEPTHNCEVSPEEPGLFMEGTEVHLRAGPARGFDVANSSRAAFGKWNLGDASDDDAERVVVMDGDLVLRPSFYQVAANGCVPLRLASGDSARVRVDMSQSSFDDDQICHHGNLATGPGESFEGSFNPVLEPVLHLHSELLNVKSLIGWDIQVAGRGRLGQLGANLELSGLRSGIVATAHACQAIEPFVSLRMESGQVIRERPEAGSELVMTKPAPNCPYADDAWLVGTTVELAALGDPAGYRFAGWSGAAQGTGLTTTVRLDGSSPSVAVTAAYDVTCYTLTLTHDKDDVTVYPAPNCRGTDPALGRYVGGSTVSMYGEVPGGKVWQGWTGDVVEKGKVNPVFVIMDDDKSAGHRWRSKSWDEQLVGGLEWFGDQVAIAAKKAVGVIALAVKELAGSGLAMIPPFSVLATVGPALSLVGTILELAGVSEDITKYLHYANETFDWMLSTFSCAASWSFASSGGGGAGSGSGTAEDIARAGLEGYDVASNAKDTAGMVMDARKAYFGVAKTAAKGTSKAAAAGGFALTVGIDVAATIMETGIGWEADAKSAWTDGTVFTDCMRESVPSFMHDVMDEIDGVV